MLFDVFSKAAISLLLLHLQHLGHLRVGGTKLQFPAHQTLIDSCPVLPRTTIHNLHGQLLELLLVVGLHRLGDNLLTVDILLQRQQYLVGVNGLDEVICNLLTDSLVHDVFLLTLCYHDDRHLWCYLLDALQCLQTTKAGHHLVEQYQVEGALFALLNGVGTVGYRHHLVTFLL